MSPLIPMVVENTSRGERSLTRTPNPGVVVSQALNCLSGFGFKARTAISVRCRRID